MIRRFVKTIQLFDTPNAPLTNEQFFRREKYLLFIKLFWVFSIIIFCLLGIIVDIRYYLYFFYYAVGLWILTKGIDLLLHIVQKTSNKD